MTKIKGKQAKKNIAAEKNGITAKSKGNLIKLGLKLKQPNFKPKKKIDLKKKKDKVMNALKKDSRGSDHGVKNLDPNNKKAILTKQKGKNRQETKTSKKNEKGAKLIIKGKQKETKNVSSDNIKFNESEFDSIVSIQNVKKVVSELKKVVSEETEKSKQVFNDYKLVLNVTYFNIPHCPKRMVKLKLKHSLLSEDDDVILFVKDLHRGSKVDYEPTIQHYEDLLREKGVTGIKTIMPFNQLKKEYGSYEMKIKLSNLYEHYLCDGAIVGHVVGFLGKKFKKPRSNIYALRMNIPNLAKEIEKTKLKTCFKQGEQGSLISVVVGNHTMSPEQIAENILMIVSQFKTCLPGGLPNIRNMYIRINIKGTSSLPIYMSNAQPPSKVPNIIGPKEEKLRKLANQANEILTKFHMSDDGKLIPLSSSEIIDRKRKQESIASPQSKKMKNENKKQKKLNKAKENEIKNNKKHSSNKIKTIDKDDNASKSNSDAEDDDMKEGGSELEDSDNEILEDDDDDAESDNDDSNNDDDDDNDDDDGSDNDDEGSDNDDDEDESDDD